MLDSCSRQTRLPNLEGRGEDRNDAANGKQLPQVGLASCDAQDGRLGTSAPGIYQQQHFRIFCMLRVN